MRKILFILMLIIISACTPTKQTVISNYEAAKYMLLEYDTIVNPNGFINLCNEEMINPKLDSWLKTSYRDFETREGISMYLFIAEMDSIEKVFTLTKRNDIYNVQKRITTNFK